MIPRTEKKGNGMERNERPLVTAVIPVYMTQRYLTRCVDSVLSQTYQKLQVILVDDGSPDDSPRICDEYAKRDERVLVIHKRNGGVSSARNAALDAARGEFITFIDSDDCVALDLVEQLLTTYKKYGGGIPICAVTREREKIRLGRFEEGIVYSPQEAMRELTLLEEEGPRFEGWSVGRLFERSLFSGIRFPEGVTIGEDLAVMYQLFDRAGKIVFVDTAKYLYENNPRSAVNSDFSRKDLLGILEVWDGFFDFVKGKYPELENCVKDRATMEAVSYYCQIARGGYTGPDIRNRLVNRIRENMPGLLCRKHPFSYKFWAVLIRFCPVIPKVLFTARAKCFKFIRTGGNVNAN